MRVDGLSGRGGDVYLGGNSLFVKFNGNSRNPFVGNLHNGGTSGGSGGILHIQGRLGVHVSFTGKSTYTGGTYIVEPALDIESGIGSSPVGFGPVYICGGALLGNATAGGSVLVGSNTTLESLVVPGINGLGGGTLAARGGIQFFDCGQLLTNINSATGSAAILRADGVQISGMSQISFSDRKGAKLATGTTFTIINNAASTPISGTFTNLPDGGTITIGQNTFQANYEGGDGNDLTLTVVSGSR